MATLVIHAPTWRVSEGAKSFQRTCETLVGEGYALARTELDAIRPGCAVIVIDKGKKQRADATLARLERTEEVTPNHLRRYNVHLAHLRMVPYGDSDTIKLNRRGVAIIH